MIPNKEPIQRRASRKEPGEASPKGELAASLHPRGMRMTPQKLAVFTILKRVNYHPTPDMVFAEVRRQYPMISLGTVYQILDQFSRIGVVRKIYSGGNRQRFDGNRQPHAHFVCERCGRIDDIEQHFVHAFARRFAQKFKGTIRNHYFEFSGLCARCAPRPRVRNRLE